MMSPGLFLTHCDVEFFFTTILWIVGFPVKKEKKKKVQPRRQTAGQQNFFLPQKKVQIINNNNRRSILPIYLPLPAFKKRNVAIYRAARSEVVSYRNFRSTSKFPVGRDTRMTCGSVRCLSSALAGNFCEGSVMMMVFFDRSGRNLQMETDSRELFFLRNLVLASFFALSRRYMHAFCEMDGHRFRIFLFPILFFLLESLSQTP